MTDHEATEARFVIADRSSERTNRWGRGSSSSWMHAEGDSVGNSQGTTWCHGSHVDETALVDDDGVGASPPLNSNHDEREDNRDGYIACAGQPRSIFCGRHMDSHGLIDGITAATFVKRFDVSVKKRIYYCCECKKSF